MKILTKKKQREILKMLAISVVISTVSKDVSPVTHSKLFSKFYDIADMVGGHDGLMFFHNCIETLLEEYDLKKLAEEALAKMGG